MPSEQLAFDRSVRHYDKDGRLHVDFTPISKANICPYLGKEIPGAEILGLDPGRIYQLFRDPDELKKAAATSNNIQLMQVHIGVTPDAPKQMEVVGTTGDKGKFKAPYLWNSLAIWVKGAIDLIESEKKKELSCSYHYDPDMTPGTYQGQHYDGVMRNIHFNHVALVEDGRAGSDVMVADAMPLELKPKPGAHNMPKAHPAMSQKAQIVRGALAIHFRPLLAADQKLDLKPVLLGTTASNYIEFKPKIIERLSGAIKGKLLSADANMEEIHELLDSLDKEGEDEMDEEAGDESPEEKEAREKAEKATKDKRARDKAAKDKKARDKAAKDRAKDATSKAAEENDEDEDDPAEDEAETEAEKEARMEKRREAMDRMSAMDEEETEEEREERMNARKEAKDRKAKDMNSPKPITEKAMDAAIDLAVERTKREMKAAASALREAEGIARPILGALAMDSADEVYRALFKAKGIDIAGVDPSAFKAMAKLAVASHQADRPKALAMDEKTSSVFASRFPSVARIRNI